MTQNANLRALQQQNHSISFHQADVPTSGLNMKKEFELSPPHKLEKILQTLRYPKIKSKSSLSEDHKKALEALQKDGFVFIENAIDLKSLNWFRQFIQRKLSSGQFNFPVLNTKKLCPEKHAELIKNHLYATLKDLEKMGLTSDQKEFESYDDFLRKVAPSTLTINAPKDEIEYYKLFLNESLLQIAEEYLGFHPIMIESYIRRNFPATYKNMNHYWHRDLNHPHYLVKMFFFFEDCSLLHGPHQFVKGTHKNFKLNGKRYYTDEEVAQIHSKEIVSSVAKAGTILIEDTRGLHRAVIPEIEHRDLGYAIFLPLDKFRTLKHPYYQLESTTFEKLSEFQKSFIPYSCIIQ